jgi:phage tail-like protein
VDANGQRFWMLGGAPADWLLGDQPRVRYQEDRRSLVLRSQRDFPEVPDAPANAEAQLAVVPQSTDAFGTRAFFDPVSAAVLATGAVPGSTVIYTVPPGQTLTDLADGYDDVLYLAVRGRVTMLDLRRRWKPVEVTAADFDAWRIATHPDGGAWVLDRARRRLARLRGMPIRDRGAYGPGTFRPCPENPDPPTLIPRPELDLPADEDAVALACNPRGQLAVLTWVADGLARLRVLGADGRFGAPLSLAGARHPFSLAWAEAGRIAVLLVGARRVTAYDIEGASGTVPPAGDVYPLPRHDGGPFLHGTTLPPHIPTVSGSTPLAHLSAPAFAANGWARNRRVVDSGNANTAWHRIYIEADIPPQCGIAILLTTTPREIPPTDTAVWHEHRFGHFPDPPARSGTPLGAWLPQSSELPFYPGLTPCDPCKGRTGLFTVLVQRAGFCVRTLTGRYLWARVRLYGDGRATPELFAVRAWGSRFSYLNRYLPELYRETAFGGDADQPGQATRPDFLERFLDNFEGILTPLEDRVAASYLVTDARTVPEESLDWLASWIGLAFDTAYPEDRRRSLLKATPDIYNRHGALQGLGLALEVATGGGVSSGRVVILEDFRLRRTFSTILGADLSDANDPLLAGIGISGNSFVGDTLFVGEENQQEFLALFRATMPATGAETAAIEEFLDRLAYRVTILVHPETSAEELGLIRRVTDTEAPAHVAVRIERASEPFLVGMAALVGVDSYLAPRPKPRPVRVDVSGLGLRDFIERPPSLDPRLEGGEASLERPIADVTLAPGTGITLDASASTAAPGRTIVRYYWTRLN